MGEFNFTHVYTSEPGKWLLIRQVAMHSTALGMGTLMRRERKKILNGLLKTSAFRIQHDPFNYHEYYPADENFRCTVRTSNQLLSSNQTI